MARISTYVKDTNLSNDDLLLGTDGDSNSKATANFPLSAITSFVETNVTFTSTTTTFSQEVAASTWAVTHSMNKFPSVTVVDSSNNVVIGEILYNSTSSITLSFASPFTGKAYLN